MPHLEYFIVAESLAIDAQTNRVSIFNVLEDVQTPFFPVNIQNVTAIAVWNADPGDEHQDFQAVFLVSTPGAEAPLQFAVNFRIPQARARTLIQIQGLPVIGPGHLRFEVQLNGQYQAFHTATIGFMVPTPTNPPMGNTQAH